MQLRLAHIYSRQYRSPAYGQQSMPCLESLPALSSHCCSNPYLTPAACPARHSCCLAVRSTHACSCSCGKQQQRAGSLLALQATVSIQSSPWTALDRRTQPLQTRRSRPHRPRRPLAGDAAN